MIERSVIAARNKNQFKILVVVSSDIIWKNLQDFHKKSKKIAIIVIIHFN